MRPRWQLGAIAATIYEVSHRLAVDLKMETDIPSEVWRSVHGKAARRVVISAEVATSVRNSADDSCTAKSQHKKNIREGVFGFHGRYCSY